MNIYYVYVWIRLDTNEVFYVGKGHGNRYKDMSMRNRYFLNIVAKVKMQNIEIKIIEDALTEEAAYTREKYWIAYYRNHSSCLTNMTDGGEGSSNWYSYLTDEEREHHREISKSFLGKKHTAETKEKMRQYWSTHTKVLTDDGRRRISESAKGRPGYG